MKRYQLIFVLITLFVSHVLLAQGPNIKGTLYDENKETIPFATVALMKLPDSTLVTGTMSDMDGQFNLQPKVTGTYYLRFSSIGYTDTFTPEFEIAQSGFNKEFGSVFLKKETTMLREVFIKTSRPQIYAENGKMVMRVAGSTIAAESSAYQMLTKAPGVSVTQNGDFQINGKSGVAVMIDGRLTYLSSAELKTFLENMPAANIKNIEVITNPSAKYDAEGSSGILNITIKKNSISGLNGSVYSGIKFNRQTLINGGVNLNYKKGKWNSFLNMDASQHGMLRDAKVYRTFPQESLFSVYEQDGVQTKKKFVPSLQMGTDYELNENHRLGIMGNFTYQNAKSDWNLKSHGILNNDTFVNIDAQNHMDENFGNSRINLHYTGKMDSIGTSISAELDYVRLQKETGSRFNNLYFYSEDNSEEPKILSNHSTSDYDIYAAKIDFSLPISETSGLETGVKASKVISNSELHSYYGIGEGRILDPDRSNNFRYQEEIYAGYLSYHNRINDTWNIMTGLRVEQTYGNGKSFTLNQTNKRDYLNVFPNLTVKQKISDNYEVNYSFSRRITRPDYELMNPFLFYLDPNTSIVGNPDIQPQISNSFQLGQTFFKKYNLTLSCNYDKNYMAELPSTDPETGQTFITTKNLNHFKSFNATVVAPIKLTSFWHINNTLVLTQQDYKMQIDGEVINNNNFFYMAQTNHQINLPAGFKLEMNATLKGPMAYGVYDIDGQWWIDAGIKRSFMNDKFNLTVRATDIFRSMDMNVNAVYGVNHFNLKQYFWQQAISINLRYSFSKGNKAEREIRKDNLEEMNRAGGN